MIILKKVLDLQITQRIKLSTNIDYAEIIEYFFKLMSDLSIIQFSKKVFFSFYSFQLLCEFINPKAIPSSDSPRTTATRRTAPTLAASRTSPTATRTTSRSAPPRP
jgi:hypothetical protein